MKWLMILLFPVLCFGLQADLNHDCIVDHKDLRILIAQWKQECMANYYLDFDGSTGYITVPDNAALQLGTSDFSVCINAAIPLANTKYIIDLYNQDSVGLKIATYLYEGDYWLSFTCNGGYFDKIYTSTSNHFYCWTVNRTTGVISLYIDSIAVTADDSVNIGAGTATTNDPLVIGCERHLIGVGEEVTEAYQNFYAGTLDDIRIYKKILSPAEIKRIYSGGVGKKYSVDDAGVAAVAWNCDEGEDTTITDEIGGLVGTFTGGVTWLAGGVPSYETGQNVETGDYDRRTVDNKPVWEEIEELSWVSGEGHAEKTATIHNGGCIKHLAVEISSATNDPTLSFTIKDSAGNVLFTDYFNDGQTIAMSVKDVFKEWQLAGRKFTIAVDPTCDSGADSLTVKIRVRGL